MSTSRFAVDVETVVGPVLRERGLILDQVCDGMTHRGGTLSIVFYRGTDCRVQVYEASREGETNCMIAPLSAPNEFGLQSRSKAWRFLGSSAPKAPGADVPTSIDEYEAAETPLHWVRAQIEQFFDAARANIRFAGDRTSVSSIDVSAAVTRYLKHYPGDNSADFDIHYAASAPTARHLVRELLDEVTSIQPDWSQTSLNEAADTVEAEMRRRHPILTADALERLGNYYTYLTR